MSHQHDIQELIETYERTGSAWTNNREKRYENNAELKRLVDCLVFQLADKGKIKQNQERFCCAGNIIQ